MKILNKCKKGWFSVKISIFWWQLQQAFTVPDLDEPRTDFNYTVVKVFES